MNAIDGQVGRQQFLLLRKPQFRVTAAVVDEEGNFLQPFVGSDKIGQIVLRSRLQRKLNIGRNLFAQRVESGQPPFQLLKQFVVCIGCRLASDERIQFTRTARDRFQLAQEVGPTCHVGSVAVNARQAVGSRGQGLQIPPKRLQRIAKGIGAGVRQNGIEIPDEGEFRNRRHELCPCLRRGNRTVSIHGRGPTGYDLRVDAKANGSELKIAPTYLCRVSFTLTL